MPKENRSHYAILGILHYAPMTGYEIQKNLTLGIGQFWQEVSASIYPSLKKLEKQDMIKGSREISENGPNKIRYEITPLGRQNFEAWMDQPPLNTAIRNEFALKLFFGQLGKKNKIIEYIYAEEQKAKEMKKLITLSGNGIPDNEESLMWKLIAQYGEKLAEATMDWCQIAREKLNG